MQAEAAVLVANEAVGFSTEDEISRRPEVCFFGARVEGERKGLDLGKNFDWEGCLKLFV